MIEFNRPYILHKTPRTGSRRLVVALNRPTLMDPAMVFTHHFELHVWIGRVYFGGLRVFWNLNQQGLQTSDAYARYSSRLYTKESR